MTTLHILINKHTKYLKGKNQNWDFLWLPFCSTISQIYPFLMPKSPDFSLCALSVWPVRTTDWLLLETVMLD